MTQAYDWPGRAEIAARAQQRWRRRRPLILVTAFLAACAGVVWGSSRHQGRARHDQSSLATRVTLSVIIVVAVFVVIVVAMLVMQRLGARWKDNYRPPIATGLPGPQRREVARAIRRGVPSLDPTLRAVERETAERLVRRRGASRWVLPAVVALELVNAFAFDRSTGMRLYFVVLAAGLVYCWLLNVVNARGAARLLAADRPFE